MGRIFMFSAALLLMSTSSWANSDHEFVCADYADAKADAWAQGRLDRVDAAEKVGPSKVLVVMAGVKYVAPLYQDNVIATSFGDTLRQRNQIYSEEFHRCLNSRSLAQALQN
jgi:hypothetical protein